MSTVGAATAWSRGIHCKIFKSSIKLYFSCFICMVFLFISKSLSMVRYLFMWEKIYVGQWVRYVLKQGNPLQKFKSLIKLYFSYILFYSFPFYIKNFIYGDIFVYVREKIYRPLRQLRPKIGKSLAYFFITNQIILILFSFLWFSFISISLSKVIFFVCVRGIYVTHWVI